MRSRSGEVKNDKPFRMKLKNRARPIWPTPFRHLTSVSIPHPKPDLSQQMRELRALRWR